MPSLGNLSPPLALLVLASIAGCSHRTPMTEYAPFPCPLVEAPIVLVGKVNYAPIAVGESHDSRFDNRPIQLFRVGINIENVLRGDLSRGPATVWFFMNVDSQGGNARLWDMAPSERDIFFLLTDAGQLRIACDGGRSCVPRVLTGPHPAFAPKKGYTMEDSVLDILLSRGQGATDQNMIDALGRSDLGFTGKANYKDKSYIKRLKIIANTEARPVAAIACDILNQFKLPCGTGAEESPE